MRKIVDLLDSKLKYLMMSGWSSTSLPHGNQVDGLPPAFSAAIDVAVNVNDGDSGDHRCCR